MRLKEGVRVQGVKPELLVALMVIEDILKLSPYGPFVATSLVDSKHMAGSLHYQGQAVDIRTHAIRAGGGKPERIAEAIRSNLTPEYDVVVEGLNTENEHIHVEFDPKPQPAVSEA